jgi:predicted DNA binding protein
MRVGRSESARIVSAAFRSPTGLTGWGKTEPRPSRRPTPATAAAEPVGGSHPLPVVSCRLRVNLPSSLWLQPFTVRHPELHVEILDRMELGEELTMYEARVLANEGRRWKSEIESLPGVIDVEEIDLTEGAEVYRVVYRGPTFIALEKRLKLFGRHPFPVHDGVARWTVVGPQERVREFLRRLQRQTDEVRIESVHRGATRGVTSPLTPRQEVVLRTAMTEGYFEVPRCISLSELAAKMGVAISTLSVTLAVIEKKVLESRVDAPG